MGAMMMAVGVELTCYYYSFLFAVAFLYHKRQEAGAILLGVTAADRLHRLGADEVPPRHRASGRT